MKISVISLDGSETVLYPKYREITLGKYLKNEEKGIVSVDINNEPRPDWKSHLLKQNDDVRIICHIGEVGTIIGIIISIAASVLSAVLAPKPKKPNKNVSSQPALGIAGIQNTIAPGTPKFLPYGKRRVFGHLIASKIDVVDNEGLGSSFLGRKMNFSAMYYMGVGPIHDICGVKVNNTNIEDLQGPPEYNIRLGTSDQTIITGHELVHQTYRDGKELQIPLRAGSSKSILASYGTPVIYTTNGREVSIATLFIHFPLGIFQYGVHGKRYGSFINAKVEYKLNSGTTWTETGFQIYSDTRDGVFWKIPVNFPSAGQWDIRVSLQPSGHGSFENGPSANLFNVMETTFVTTAYPGNALLEVNGVASDQVTGFEEMETSAIVCGRLVEVYRNGIYVKEFSRNRVWIVRDLLLNREVGLGNRMSAEIWDNAAGLEAATYYEGTTLNFDDELEIRDYCDVILTDPKPGWDHIKNLLYEGRAILLPSSGRYKYIIDKDKTLQPDNFLMYSSPGNIIEGTLQTERGQVNKPTNTIRAEFANEGADYKVIPAKLVYPGTEDEPERPENVSFISITRLSQVSREMNFRLKTLRLIKRRWAWKSPETALGSEPLDIGKLAYKTSKHLRGYTGLIQNNNSTPLSINTGKEIYLATGSSYSVHVRHLNTIEEKFISNTVGNTYSILSLTSPLSFTPTIGDLWIANKTVDHVAIVQFDESELDGNEILLKCHEHIPEIYIDTLTDVTEGENTSTGTIKPQPLLGAQVKLISGSIYQANVIPGFNSLVGTYSALGTNSIFLSTSEPQVDDFFNDAYITFDSSTKHILDYIGSTRQAILDSSLTAGTVSGEYIIAWNGYNKTTGFNISYSSTLGGSYTSLANVTGTSYSFSLTGASYFKFKPLDSMGNTNENGVWIVAPGVTDTTVPLAPFTIDIDQSILRITLDTPASRDLHQLESNFYIGSITGSGLTPTFIDVSDTRDETHEGIISRAATYDLSDYAGGTTLFGKAATIDFYGNRSDYAITFAGVTLSNNEADTPTELIIESDSKSVTFAGSTQQTLFSTTLSGGEIGSENSVELDIMCLVSAATTQSTTLAIDYRYGGLSAGSFSCSIADGSSKIDVDTPYWLNFFLSPNGGIATSQNAKIYKWGDEIPTNSLRSNETILSKDSNIDQTLEVLLTITGATTSTVRKVNQQLKQLLTV